MGKYEVWGGSDKLGTTWYIEIVIGCYRSGWLSSHISGQRACLVSGVIYSGVPTAGRGESHMPSLAPKF